MFSSVKRLQRLIVKFHYVRRCVQVCADSALRSALQTYAEKRFINAFEIFFLIYTALYINRRVNKNLKTIIQLLRISG